MQSEQTSLDTFKPGLAAFGLHAAELASLAEQGFVATELRNGRVYYKLRFRIGTRQCVRYLGTDPVLVACVQNELEKLQQGNRLQRELGRLARTARLKLKAAKQQLVPLLNDAGFSFHGLSIRRPRSAERQ